MLVKYKEQITSIAIVTVTVGFVYTLGRLLLLVVAKVLNGE